MKRLFRCSLGVGLMSWMALKGRSEEAWVVPERFEVTPGATLQLDLLAVEMPDKLSSANSTVAGTLLYARFRLGDRTTDIWPQDLRDGAARLSVSLQQPGVASVAVGLRPIVAEISPDELAVELRKLHLGSLFQDEIKSRLGQRRSRLSMRTHAKVFVRVGLPIETDRDWEKLMGAELELVPRQNPTNLRAGKTVQVRVWHKGTAVANMAVNFRTIDGAQQHVTYTDSEGWAEANLGVAGKWLVYGSLLRLPAELDGFDLAIELATLTLEVR